MPYATSLFFSCTHTLHCAGVQKLSLHPMIYNTSYCRTARPVIPLPAVYLHSVFNLRQSALVSSRCPEIFCLVIFNIGVGLVLSALFVFFRDVSYLYDVFIMLLMYMSAIFYTVDSFPSVMQKLFLVNPIYCYIKYFRVIVLEGEIPSAAFHVLCLFYALIMVLIGSWIYKKYNHKFLYYV